MLPNNYGNETMMAAAAAAMAMCVCRILHMVKHDNNIMNVRMRTLAAQLKHVDRSPVSVQCNYHCTHIWPAHTLYRCVCSFFFSSLIFAHHGIAMPYTINIKMKLKHGIIQQCTICGCKNIPMCMCKQQWDANANEPHSAKMTTIRVDIARTGPKLCCENTKTKTNLETIHRNSLF